MRPPQLPAGQGRVSFVLGGDRPCHFPVSLRLATPDGGYVNSKLFGAGHIPVPHYLADVPPRPLEFFHSFLGCPPPRFDAVDPGHKMIGNGADVGRAFQTTAAFGLALDPFKERIFFQVRPYDLPPARTTPRAALAARYESR